MSTDFSQYPEWHKAVAREREIRESGYLGLPTFLAAGAVSVQPLTLQQQGILYAIGSPLLSEAAPVTINNVKAALWAMQPDYAPTNAKGRARFETALSKIKGLDWELLAADLTDFVRESMLDAPFPRSREAAAPPVCSSAAYVHRFAKAYGWTRAEILASPVICLNQEERMISHEARLDRRQPSTFPPGRIVSRVEREIINAERRLAAQANETA